jgi:hypothetical protein
MRRRAASHTIALLLGISLLSCSENPIAPSRVRPGAARLDESATRPSIVISQIYGGSGNSGAPLNDARHAQRVRRDDHRSSLLALGSYTVNLSVTDKDGAIGSRSLAVNVARRPVPTTIESSTINLNRNGRGNVALTLTNGNGVDVSLVDVRRLATGVQIAVALSVVGALMSGGGRRRCCPPGTPTAISAAS